jgi:putative endonuclease
MTPRRAARLGGPARTPHLQPGASGERLAAEYLKRRGYRVVVTNFVAPLGRGLAGRALTGEIDIIAYDDATPTPTLVFVEVKTRSRADFAPPEAAVDLRKQRQIIRAARVYRRMLLLTDEPCRYDVVSIVVGEGAAPGVMLLRGYFTEERFKRGGWWSREGRY